MSQQQTNNVYFVEPTWAIVEMMGHQTIAGQITEVCIAGSQMLRVDVPAIRADTQNEAISEYTRFIGGSAVYSITPVDRITALHAIAHLRVVPVSPYKIPYKAIAAPQHTDYEEYEGIDDDGIDDEDGDDYLPHYDDRTHQVRLTPDDGIPF